MLAAYKYGEPYRKRRVKVPADTPWKDFLALFYSRLDLNRHLDLEIFDENGIEIVSVDDLIDNDVLVVREKKPIKSIGSISMVAAPMATSSSWQHHQDSRQGLSTSVRDTPSDPFRRPHEQAQPYQAPPRQSPSHQAPPHHHGGQVPLKMMPVSSSSQSPGVTSEHAPSVKVGPPTLSHFIQCNSFGHYFLAEAENLKLQLVPGKSRKAHCVVKVPHTSVGKWGKTLSLMSIV